MLVHVHTRPKAFHNWNEFLEHKFVLSDQGRYYIIVAEKNCSSLSLGILQRSIAVQTYEQKPSNGLNRPAASSIDSSAIKLPIASS